MDDSISCSPGRLHSLHARTMWSSCTHALISLIPHARTRWSSSKLDRSQCELGLQARGCERPARLKDPGFPVASPPSRLLSELPGRPSRFLPGGAPRSGRGGPSRRREATRKDRQATGKAQIFAPRSSAAACAPPSALLRSISPSPSSRGPPCCSAPPSRTPSRCASCSPRRARCTPPRARCTSGAAAAALRCAAATTAPAVPTSAATPSQTHRSSVGNPEENHFSIIRLRPRSRPPRQRFATMPTSAGRMTRSCSEYP